MHKSNMQNKTYSAIGIEDSREESSMFDGERDTTGEPADEKRTMSEDAAQQYI